MTVKPPLIPSEQCTATSVRSGQRCRRLVVASNVCTTHGGAAPQVKAKRAERIALAEQFAKTPRRHPAEVLMDAVHVNDVLAQSVLREVEAGGTVTVKQVKALVEASNRSATLARTALSADAEQRLSRDSSHDARRVEAALTHFMAAVGLTGDTKAEAALRASVAAVSDGTTNALERAVDQRGTGLDQQTAERVAVVLNWLLARIGMRSSPWARGQLAMAMRGLADPSVVLVDVPAPRSFWAELAAVAADGLSRASAERLPLAIEA
jgi:hypothetical protein